MSNISLNSLKVAALVALHNGAMEEYGAPEGFTPIKAKGLSRSRAVEAVEALCAAGNLAVTFDGETATIVDASAPMTPADILDNVIADINAQREGNNVPEGDDDSAPEGDDDSAPEGDGETALATGGADGKGAARAWGFATASDAWLEANPRGSEAREAYRKERRKAARMGRKAARAIKEAAREAANS